jgi:hypothetical protein
MHHALYRLLALQEKQHEAKEVVAYRRKGKQTLVQMFPLKKGKGKEQGKELGKGKEKGGVGGEGKEEPMGKGKRKGKGTGKGKGKGGKKRRVIRIGYVSADFGDNHPVTVLLGSVFKVTVHYRAYTVEHTL